MLPFEHDLANAADHCHRTGRPLVTLTYAQSLDGSLAARRDRPLALSGPQSLRLTHQLRAAHDAILVGIGTVLADDPSLTVRLSPGDHPQPVVLDSTLRISLTSRLVADPVHPLWVATRETAPADRRIALAKKGVQFINLPCGPNDGVSLPGLLSRLAEKGISSLMVEGGARVITSFLSQRLVDQVLLTIAPCFVGGLPVLDKPFPAEFPRLENMRTEKLGDDLIVWGWLPTRP